MSAMTGDFERAVRFIEAMQDRMAERVVPLRLGTALFHDQLPHAWQLNFVRLERDDAELTAEDVVVMADELQGSAGLPYRKLEVNVEALGGRLEPVFRGVGWRVRRNILMSHGGEAPAARVAAEEVDPRALRPKWEQGIRSAPWAAGNEEWVRQQRAAQDLRTGSGTRCFAARADGRLVSECLLFSDGRTAQVEAVHTLEEYRGRGLARGVVTLAVAEARRAGHDLVFILADDEDWPKELYRKLGFTEIGRVWGFVRPPQT